MLTEGSGHLEPDNFGQKHIDRLAQHYRFGLNPAYTPAKNTEAVDHGGMTVCPDKRIRKSHVAAAAHHGCEMFKIDLMNDPCSRRHDTKIIKSPLPPLQKLISLPVSLKLLVKIFFQSIGTTVIIHLHRMIDYKVAGNKRINPGRIPAE